MGPIGKLRISIVDDDEAVRDSLIGLVESLGAEARAHGSLAAFLAAPDPAGTDCLLLDRSRRHGAAALPLDMLAARGLCIPVVAMVRDETGPTVAAALREGADAVLPRPFTDRALLSAIREARRRRGTRRGDAGLAGAGTTPA